MCFLTNFEVMWGLKMNGVINENVLKPSNTNLIYFENLLGYVQFFDVFV